MTPNETTEKKPEPAAAKPEQQVAEVGDKSDEAASSAPGPARSNERRSLFLKKIPIPTSEEEVKNLFPAYKSKVSFD
jgi:RNA recognition motif-containing protein